MTFAEMRTELQRELLLLVIGGVTVGQITREAVLLKHGRPLVRAHVKRGTMMLWEGEPRRIEKIHKGEVLFDKPRRIIATLPYFLSCIVNGKVRDCGS